MSTLIINYWGSSPTGSDVISMWPKDSWERAGDLKAIQSDRFQGSIPTGSHSQSIISCSEAL